MNNKQQDLGDKIPSSHVSKRRGSGGSTRSRGTTASGQSVSTSGSFRSPSTRSETPVMTPINDTKFNDADDDAESQGGVVVGKKKKRGQRATRGDKKVCQKVEKMGRTTYSQVADELVAEFSKPVNGIHAPNKLPRQQYDEKNIRRRVYDALNVFTAMDIMFKDKKDIHWKGLPLSFFNNIQQLKSDRLALQSRFEKKSAYLQELQDQYEGLQNLIQRNRELYSSGNAPAAGVALPFILVQTRPHATLEVEISEDMQLVHFDFNTTPFEIHDDNHVLKAMQLCNQSKSGDDMANNSYCGYTQSAC
ncbi:transcription factor-like protein DPB isoform X2 [Rutidosis leptorrhynchoides]|uniref:transcription factor-like protein DPB isoform X2 n=1 Tax=Rutidosis leptorrhynchoides TaxID=125765 RepID=UPI003A990ED8